jgi:DNA-binding SARP family transcriptional activator
MRYGILGPLEVLGESGLPLALGGTKQRAVLAILLLRTGEVVSADRLMDDLWGDDPPETAANTLQVYISQLRKTLRVGGAEPLVTQSPGYRFEVGHGELDLHGFDRLTHEARSRLDAGDSLSLAWT